MIGIVGIPLVQSKVRQRLTEYLSGYYAALERAINEAGGRLQISVSGGDPWAPALPDDLRPAWVVDVRATHDGETFYIDLDGPVQHGVFVTRAIAVRLDWQAGVDGTETFRIRDVEIEPLRIRLFDDQSLDLGEARAAMSGLIAAGKLMASLLEPAGGE